MNNASSVQQGNILYVGTSEQNAKIAPLKGLEAPIILTDVYPGFFCLEVSKDNATMKWGIISINVDRLHKEMFAPFHFYLQRSSRRKASLNPAEHKNKWQKSLKEFGVCSYLTHIPPIAIEKITIYQPFGGVSNIIINKLIIEQNPYKINHKDNYKKSLCITRWLNGEDIGYQDICNGNCNGNGIQVADIEGKLHNRSALDIYYIKPEDKTRKTKAAKEIINDD